MSRIVEALSLVFVIEGLLPLVSPGTFRKLYLEVLALDDRTLRIVALVSIAVGLLGLVWFSA